MPSRNCLLAALALFACAPKPAVRTADLPSSYPGGAAVLPFDNETTSMEAADRLRKMIHARLGGPSPETVDEALRGLGITDGGQLAAVTPAAVGAALGSAALLYGSVEAFDFQNLGFVRRKVVRVKLKLVEASTGAQLWEATGEGKASDATIRKGEGQRRFFEGVFEQAAEKLLRVTLQEEAQQAVNNALGSYPWR